MKRINGYWVPDNDHNLVLDLLGPGGEHDNAVFLEIRKLNRDQPKRLFVDIGANIGRWCKEFSKEYDKVRAFEPASYNYECLHENTKEDENIVLYNYGIGETHTKAKLSVAVENHLGSTMAKPSPNGNIELQPLDDQGAEFECMDLLKIDVEGFETEVLKGGKRIIQHAKPLIAIERHAFNYNLLGKNKKESHLYLQSIGYELMFKLTRDCIYGRPGIHYKS